MNAAGRVVAGRPEARPEGGMNASGRVVPSGPAAGRPDARPPDADGWAGAPGRPGSTGGVAAVAAGRVGDPGGSDPTGVVAADVVAARVYLARVAEPPALPLVRFVAEVGPVAAAARVRAGEVPDDVAALTRARRDDDRVAADLAAAAASGLRLLTPEHPAWPGEPFAALTGCGEATLAPPLALWVRGPGDLARLTGRAVAVVGARAATGYGTHMAGEFAAGLAGRGITVVSGAAIGIDGAAHRGALAAGGPTVAVLACGADRAYPPSHEALLHRIAATGLVVSEYPPGTAPGRHRFLVRNRLIAALAGGTLVVEAGLRSGATRTAADAATLGRALMAVPGPITSGPSAGCHRLVREGGAELVTRIEEVLEALGPIGATLADVPSGPRRATDGLDPVGLLVHDALPARAARSASWLAVEAGVPVGAARVALLDLGRRGLAEQHDGLWQRSLPARR